MSKPEEIIAELLEACRTLLGLWDACGECSDEGELADFVINNFDCADTARAIIAKAEGELG